MQSVELKASPHFSAHAERTACAMARRCSTALVEPPSAMMMTIAFSNAARVMMSRGLMSAFSSSSTVLQAERRNLALYGQSAWLALCLPDILTHRMPLHAK